MRGAQLRGEQIADPLLNRDRRERVVGAPQIDALEAGQPLEVAHLRGGVLVAIGDAGIVAADDQQRVDARSEIRRSVRGTSATGDDGSAPDSTAASSSTAKVRGFKSQAPAMPSALAASWYA